VYLEKHFSVCFLTIEAHVKHMQHRHRVSAPRHSNQVWKLFLGLAVSNQAILESMIHIVLETLIAAGFLLNFYCGALFLTLEAKFANRGNWLFHFGLAGAVLTLFLFIMSIVLLE
jgi:hypothetical protein